MTRPRFAGLDADWTRPIDLGAPAADVWSVMALLQRATSMLPRTPRLGDARGYRLFWSSGRELRWRDVVADGRCHVVVGRHPAAHVRLVGDGAVALRHLVLRARPAGAGVELRVLDLGSPLPLLLDGGERATSAAITGPLVARLGAHPLCALPFDGCVETDEHGGPGAADRPDDLDALEGLDEPSSQVGVVPHRDMASPARTEIRSLLGSAHIETYREPCGVPWAELRLEGEHGKVRLQVAREQLDRLVLVGRYPRCASGLLPIFDDVVSRVHLGLVRSGDAIEVLDLGSTHGTYVDGRPVHRALVHDRATFALAGDGGSVEVSLLE